MKSPKSTRKTVFSKRKKQTLLVIFILSLLLASAMELYTFGIAANFLARWFRAFFVIFTLLSVTALGIVPGVTIVINRVIKRFSF